MNPKNETVFYPAQIKDTPFPEQNGDVQFGQAQGSKDAYFPQTISDRPLPRPVTASEVIGQALNTQSKKILGDFRFTQSGALSIGNYVEGVTGDVRLTPLGITARNKEGQTTFLLDAITGDAIFKGKITKYKILGIYLRCI